MLNDADPVNAQTGREFAERAERLRETMSQLRDKVVVGLRGALAQKDANLAAAMRRIRELEKVLAETQDESAQVNARLEAALGERQQVIAAADVVMGSFGHGIGAVGGDRAAALAVLANAKRLSAPPPAATSHSLRQEPQLVALPSGERLPSHNGESFVAPILGGAHRRDNAFGDQRPRFTVGLGREDQGSPEEELQLKLHDFSNFVTSRIVGEDRQEQSK